MPISVEFQIAGLVYTIILCAAFFRKVKWDSVQNRIYRALLLAVLLALSLDIASVISIDHRDNHPLLNDVISKAYLVSMVLYIFLIDCYAITCAESKNFSALRKKADKALIILLALAAAATIALICANTLYYSGYDRRIFSYGFPSDLVYLFSSFSVAFVFLVMLLNVRNIRLSKLFSILSFCFMEGAIALVQMFNKELLLVGFSSAVTVFIMYFTVENPDEQTISRLSKANKRARDLLRFYSTNSLNKANYDSAERTMGFYQNACVLSMDIVDFDRFAERMGIERLSKYLSGLFDKIDGAAEAFDVEKIRSVGGSYMAVAGLPEENNACASEAVRFALEILKIFKRTNEASGMNLQVRIGVAGGAFMADLVGRQNFVFNAWSAAIGLAERLRETCAPNSVHVSESVYERLKELYDFEEFPEALHNGSVLQRSFGLRWGGGISDPVFAEGVL